MIFVILRIIISPPYKEFRNDITVYIRLKIYFLNMSFFCSTTPPLTTTNGHFGSQAWSMFTLLKMYCMQACLNRQVVWVRGHTACLGSYLASLSRNACIVYTLGLQTGPRFVYRVYIYACFQHEGNTEEKDTAATSSLN
jgi:hypothetical protein